MCIRQKVENGPVLSQSGSDPQDFFSEFRIFPTVIKQILSYAISAQTYLLMHVFSGAPQGLDGPVREIASNDNAPTFPVQPHSDHASSDSDHGGPHSDHGKPQSDHGSSHSDHHHHSFGEWLSGEANSLARMPSQIVGGAAKAVGDGVHSTGDEAKHLTKDVLHVPSLWVNNFLESRVEPHGKFPKFPKELNVSPPASYSDLKPNAPASIIPKDGVQLNDKNDTATIGIHMDKAGPARIDINASGPGTSWATKNDTSAVLSLYVDGKYDQDVVLWGGSKNTPYALSLGDLPAGDHDITLRYAKEKSAAHASGIDIQSGSATAVSYANKTAELVAKYAPVMYGLNGIESNSMQTPLGMWDQVNHNKDGTTSITYGYYFSNENGGDGAQPAQEQSEWGRLTDIQTVLKVQVGKDGDLDKISYVGTHDKWEPFTGKYQGTHPVIKDNTPNNDVTDSGGGPLLFKMPPDYNVPLTEPTAEIMNQNVQWWQTMYDEINREGKIDHNGDGDKPVKSTVGQIVDFFKVNALHDVNQMADPRRYLYIQYDGDGGKVAAEVTLKDGKHYFSDFGVSGDAVGVDGWNQTAVLLPKGTDNSEIANVQFVPRGHHGGQVSQIGRIFELNQDFEAVDVNAPHQEG